MDNLAKWLRDRVSTKEIEADKSPNMEVSSSRMIQKRVFERAIQQLDGGDRDQFEAWILEQKIECAEGKKELDCDTSQWDVRLAALEAIEEKLVEYAA